MRPEAGQVTLDGRDIRSYAPKEFARRVAVLPQQPVAPDGVLVAELVSRGRHPHRGWFGGRSSDDDRIVAEVLEATGTAELADRAVSELSGGQRQRVWIAMALAQRADIVLLDEPTSFLDVSHQLELLDLLTESNREHGTTVVMVLHELNLAARYADHLVVVDRGPDRRGGGAGRRDDRGDRRRRLRTGLRRRAGPGGRFAHDRADRPVSSRAVIRLG